MIPLIIELRNIIKLKILSLTPILILLLISVLICCFICIQVTPELIILIVIELIEVTPDCVAARVYNCPIDIVFFISFKKGFVLAKLLIVSWTSLNYVWQFTLSSLFKFIVSIIVWW